MHGSLDRVLKGAAFLPTCLLLALPVAYAQITVSNPMPAQVTVHVGDRGTDRVAATIFGSFLEPIGNSINNGIVAEILTNGSLESGLWNHNNLENMLRDEPELIDPRNSTGIPLPWEPLDPAAGKRYELHVGDAANSWQSLELIGLSDTEVGIQQKVYLSVQRELDYRVSFWAKHLNGRKEITVFFRNRETGAKLAESRLEAPAANWTKYHAMLQLKPGAMQHLEAVDFGIAVEGNERAEIDEISVLPADAIGILDPDAVAMAKAMHVTELRLGGNFSSYYHWKDGIGPADKRVTMENIAWGIPEYNEFGTDEFLQLCDLIGAIPQFDLNMGSGTPEEAAEWVRYIRAHHQGRVIFELGNELYGKWQVGYKTADQIAPDTLPFSKVVRAIVPDASIIATGQGPLGGDKWNAEQLTNPAGTFDDLSLHFILDTNHPALETATPDFTAAAAYALPYAVGPSFDKVQEQIDARPELRGKVHLAVTEWLFNSKGNGERNFTDESPSWMNEGGAVMAAGFLNTVLRHASGINITDMTGIMEFAGIWKKRGQVFAVPAYYVFKLYSSVAGDTVLPVTTDSGSYDVNGGIRPLDRVDGVPYIDVVATENARTHSITLLCLNRDLNQDVPVVFDMGPRHIVGTVHADQISAGSRYELNDEVDPNHIVPRPVSFEAPADGRLKVTLPHESVMVIHVGLP